MYFSKQIRTSKGDEYYTPDYAVEIIIPYIKQYKHIWCPFDKEYSEFVKLLKDNGYEVTFGHIEQDKISLNMKKLLKELSVL